MTSVLVRNGVVELCEHSSKAWLKNAPRGAYTTARTYGPRSVFEWGFHVERMATSIRAMSASAPAAITDAQQLAPRMKQECAAAMRELFQRGLAPEHQRLTVLIAWGDQSQGDFDVYTFAEPLPPLPAPPIMVEVRGAPRVNPLAKDSEWVRARDPLLQLKAPNCEEIILAGEDGSLLEGASTNFYAVVGDTLYTAGEGVLMGTVRKLVLEVCAREGVPVVLEPPNLANLSSWAGAMVSSTSRLLLPINEVVVPKPDHPADEQDRRVQFDTSGGLARQLADWVAKEVEANSEALF